MTNCEASGKVHRLFFVKTNHRRGAFVEHVYMDSIRTKGTLRVAEIDTDVLYQWRDLVPTYKDTLTRINDIYLSNIEVDSANAIYEFRGDERLPIRNVVLRNIAVDCVKDTVNRAVNVEALKVDNVTYNSVSSEILSDIDMFLGNK